MKMYLKLAFLYTFGALLVIGPAVSVVVLAHFVSAWFLLLFLVTIPWTGALLAFWSRPMEPPSTVSVFRATHYCDYCGGVSPEDYYMEHHEYICLCTPLKS